MYPPVDPWDTPDEPTPPLPPFRYGRAAVPVPPVREPTAELPVLIPSVERVVPRGLSYERTSRASMRSLADGWGFTFAGLVVAFSGWGTWAAAGRGRLSSPLVGLILVVVVAVVVFVASRLLGFIVLQQMLRRSRPHARWAHALTGLYLTVAGVSYFANTTWLVDGVDWINHQWGQL